MKLIKLPIAWFTLFGMVVGYVGIPVYQAVYARWVWHRPEGYRFASILILGSLGCLVGLFLHYWIWKRPERKPAMWTTALLSLAMVFGVVGVFRYQAYNETTVWSTLNTGFVRVLAAYYGNAASRGSGVQLTQAGADIQAGVNMGSELLSGEESQKLTTIASAFSEAGYYIVIQKDKGKLAESVQFVKQSGAAIRRDLGNQSYPDRTNNLDEVLSTIYSDIPPDFVNTWPAN